MASVRKTVWMYGAGPAAAPALTGDLADLMRALRTLVDPYRPELHYMRGPGPKWHAKHDPEPAASDCQDVPSLASRDGLTA